MRHSIETRHAHYEQRRRFALFPKRTTYAGWVWLHFYWTVVKCWGWGFVDEFTFQTEAEADNFFDKLVEVRRSRSATSCLPIKKLLGP